MAFFLDLQVVDVETSELVHSFTPCRGENEVDLPPPEPPIVRMFTSFDGQWLAAINCFGDIYVFNLEIQRYEKIRFLFSFDIGFRPNGIVGWCTRKLAVILVGHVLSVLRSAC